MIQSFQKESPKVRINIKLDLHTGGAQKKVELPLKLWVMAEFSLAVNLTVQNTLAENGSEENIALTFRQINDFEPEQVVRQIPQLRAALFTAGRTGIGQGVGSVPASDHNRYPFFHTRRQCRRHENHLD
ncbi:type VI secretion system contractile sheath small subunit [Photorhabdus thracensis]|uniref:type VI secretion system contractile sheath small subunit n=1 Tax=Photorhabdus thracensis TaxID=230089 RepID=UPI001E5E8F2A|nr:type VI secretion system contractile sheath small subunit [Photorhabdus thracensis]MCC8422252.1 type VI secretion system contractile sheath small subunit [Photorhabdus thracensis]